MAECGVWPTCLPMSWPLLEDTAVFKHAPGVPVACLLKNSEPALTPRPDLSPFAARGPPPWSAPSHNPDQPTRLSNPLSPDSRFQIPRLGGAPHAPFPDRLLLSPKLCRLFLSEVPQLPAGPSGPLQLLSQISHLLRLPRKPVGKDLCLLLPSAKQP